MAKSLSSILSQIERLQREAASIQSEVIARIRKEIEKYGLTAEQLFGVTTRATKKPKGAAAKAPKYGDGAGNTWGGMGKRPAWLREAIDAGKTLEDFLIAKVASTRSTRSSSSPAKGRKQAVQPKPVPNKRGAAKKVVTKKRAKVAGRAAATAD